MVSMNRNADGKAVASIPAVPVPPQAAEASEVNLASVLMQMQMQMQQMQQQMVADRAAADAALKAAQAEAAAAAAKKTTKEKPTKPERFVENVHGELVNVRRKGKSAVVNDGDQILMKPLEWPGDHEKDRIPEYIAKGMSEEEAVAEANRKQAEALRKFGGRPLPATMVIRVDGMSLASALRINCNYAQTLLTLVKNGHEGKSFVGMLESLVREKAVYDEACTAAKR